MSSKTKKIILISSSIFCAVLICTALILKSSAASESNLIAFYRVPEKVQTAVIDLVNKKAETENKTFEALLLDNSKSLESQSKIIKKCSCLIYTNDSVSEKFLNTTALPVDLSVAGGFPSSIVNSLKIEENTSKSEKTVKIIPFLYDFYEIDINYPLYTKAGIDSVDVWEDLIVCAYKEKPLTPAPMLLPFATDAEFLNCVGMIAEALCGYEEYEKMIEEFRIASEAEASVEESEADFTSLHRVLETLTAEDKILGSTLEEIKSLLRSGIIPRNALTFSDEDVFFYMDNELSGVNFTKLSQHRKVSKQAANHLISVYCPSVEATPERKFSADCICVSALKKNKNALRFVGLLSDDWQNELATKTGLAPVQKNSLVPDHQADDVRFWLAASKGPVLPLARVFFTPEQQQFAATYLRTALKL